MRDWPNEAEQECEALVMKLNDKLVTDGLFPTYNMTEFEGDEGLVEWIIAWYDRDDYRNSLSCWADDGEGVWSKYKSDTNSSDRHDFNVLTDNPADIITRILGE